MDKGRECPDTPKSLLPSLVTKVRATPVTQDCFERTDQPRSIILRQAFCVCKHPHTFADGEGQSLYSLQRLGPHCPVSMPFTPLRPSNRVRQVARGVGRPLMPCPPSAVGPDDPKWVRGGPETSMRARARWRHDGWIRGPDAGATIRRDAHDAVARNGARARSHFLKFLALVMVSMAQ